VLCDVCGTETYKAQKALNGSKSGKFFCGKSCQTKWRNKFYSGNRHPNFKEGAYAYRTILKHTGAEQICALCGIKDRRVLAVHHIDLDHSNNVPANLAWLCHNCHFLVHHDKLEKRRFSDILKSRRNMVAMV
jgi:5-methylcytosine-specific restriction endonuclease McrA